MVGMTLYINKKCKKKDKCLRFLTKSESNWQSYCCFDEKNYEHFVKANKKESNIDN